MNCKPHKPAMIVKSLNTANLMKVVTTTEVIGFFEKDEQFQYRGELYRAPITDHYWWVVVPSGQRPLETGLGETNKAYSPDSWLQPFPEDPVEPEADAETLDLKRERTVDA